MMKNGKMVLILALALICGAGAVVFFSSPSGEEETTPKIELKEKKIRPAKRKSRPRRETSFVKPIKGREGSYRIELPKDEEESLTEAYKRLLEELRRVADPLDKTRLLALVRRIQDSDEWPDGIPLILHTAAIEALSELGADGAAELSGYLASSEVEVREEAMDAIIDSVDSDSMSDYEKSEMIKQFARVLTDGDALESLFDIIDMDMRNSVQADTMRDILEHGTPEAKKKLMEETLPEIIDNEDVTDIEQAKTAVDEWLSQNPDDEDDEETYKGTEEDADDKEGDEEDTVSADSNDK